MSNINYTIWVKEYKDSKFDVKIGYFPDDSYIEDCFDDTEHNINEIAQKINMGNLEWFVARVQVLYDGIEMGCSYLGGCLYEDAYKAVEDGLDGYLEDMICEAKEEAVDYFNTLYQKMTHDL